MTDAQDHRADLGRTSALIEATGWFLICHLESTVGTPRPIGAPVRGRDRAARMRDRLAATGGHYVLFAIDPGEVASARQDALLHASCPVTGVA